MKTIRKGSRNAEDVVMLQELLKVAGYPIKVDGIFGDGTDAAVRDYQKTSGLVADGVVGEQTWMKLLGQAPEYAEARSEKFLTERDLISASKDREVELAAVKAVTEVEAGSHGSMGASPRSSSKGTSFGNASRPTGSIRRSIGPETRTSSTRRL